MVRTHHTILVEHGLDPELNPAVTCACGRVTNADMCVDITPLPLEYRQALGLERVDYLCDGCRTRLFRDRHVSEDEFYALLGQEDLEALFRHNEMDQEWKRGRDERHQAHLPRHTKVTHQRAKDIKNALKADEVMAPTAPIPLRFHVRSHEHAFAEVIQQLRSAGIV
jgi:hypothetical protein